jgi:hypothetical protein
LGDEEEGEDAEEDAGQAEEKGDAVAGFGVEVSFEEGPEELEHGVGDW